MTEFRYVVTPAEHNHPDKEKGAIGGHITYRFTPTGIGLVMKAACCFCLGKENECDFSDYEEW